MKPSDIARAYNQITHLWVRDEFDKGNGIKQHERAIAFVKSRGYALDVGCGCTGRFIVLLKEAGFTPEGVDISSEMVRLAKDRHPDVHFYEVDICQWQLPKQYDFISAWDSVWHVPLERHAFVLKKLIAALKSGGVLIFSCGGLYEEHSHIEDAMGPAVYYSTLGIPGFLQLIVESGCLCRHLEFDQYPELHAYFIVQKI
ncbi:MAG: class I SAM-dependent methyltransferase [Gammaproteobacteria bacterium]|nr:class I SAM-dependent methyltransferase [Gammaproteobacteria bacterium]